jgi:N6-adenosine-specific RNA methylase IME4
MAIARRNRKIKNGRHVRQPGRLPALLHTTTAIERSPTNSGQEIPLHPGRSAVGIIKSAWYVGAEQHYSLMSVESICALRVDQLAVEDAHLWLWVTNATLHAGHHVMEAWGFSYRSCLTWIKPRFGLGNYLRNSTEHVLFGIRGRAPIQFRSQGTWFWASMQEHSHKPEEIFAIVQRCSPGPYLELFARRKQPGWHVWGNEVTCDVAL